MWKLYVFFFVSGFPALLYQVVWQRSLFTIYGANSESITVVVSAFLLGLGIGSLTGGRLSRQQRYRAQRSISTRSCPRSRSLSRNGSLMTNEAGTTTPAAGSRPVPMSCRLDHSNALKTPA